MKRKVGLFLLAVMVAVSLGATIVASLAMYRLVSEKQDIEISKLEASLAERFAVFETMLRSQHERITAHMDKVLPEIAAELEAAGPPAAGPVGRRARRAGRGNTASSTSTSSTARTRCSRPTLPAT